MHYMSRHPGGRVLVVADKCQAGRHRSSKRIVFKIVRQSKSANILYNCISFMRRLFRPRDRTSNRATREIIHIRFNYFHAREAWSPRAEDVESDDFFPSGRMWSVEITHAGRLYGKTTICESILQEHRLWALSLLDWFEFARILQNVAPARELNFKASNVIDTSTPVRLEGLIGLCYV